MSCMSCSLSDAACACMVLWPRCPDLYALSAATMYSGCCPPTRGTGIVRIRVMVAGDTVAAHAGDGLHPSLRGISCRVRRRRERECKARCRGANQHRTFHPFPVLMASRRVIIVSAPQFSVGACRCDAKTRAQYTYSKSAHQQWVRVACLTVSVPFAASSEKESGMAETKDTRAALPEPMPTNFIRQAIDADIVAGKVPDRVVTRFPPEPNGYLHIGHAKSICLNFGIARDYPGAMCRLRFDDTNPTKERVDFMDEIQADVRWLGFDWGDRTRHASDYFEPLYDYAVRLIESGHAYVCSLGPEEIRAYRGTLTEPGRDSPHRSRSVAENLDLFARMRDGEFEGRDPCAAREDRHGVSEHEPSGSGDLSNREHAASPYRPGLVRLSHVRFRAGALGCHRGSHPFAVHSRVRGPSPSLRVVPRYAEDSVSAASNRVRSAEPDAYGDEQALPHPVGRRRIRRWLGRSPHAHHRRECGGEGSLPTPCAISANGWV